MCDLEKPVTPKEVLKNKLYHRKIAFRYFVACINRQLEQGKKLIEIPLYSGNKISLHDVFFLIKCYYEKYGWQEVNNKTVIREKHLIHFIPKKKK